MTERPNPGRELDRLVAEAIGWYEAEGQPRRCKDHPNDEYCGLCWGWDNYPSYSTDMNAAIKAWEWLEDHHSWVYLDRRETKSHILLGKYENKPTVFVMRSQWESSRMDGTVNLAFVGDTYPHAICLAVLEARCQNN